MTRLVIAATTLALTVAAVALRIRRDAMTWAEWDTDDPSEVDEHEAGVPMAAWDGTARYDRDTDIVRIRWMRTTTEV